MTPRPAHGDGPTGPSAPTGRTEPPRDLRERLADALRHAEHVCDEDCERRDHTYLPFDQEDPERRTTVHTTTGAILDAVLHVIEAETAALRQRIEEVEDQRDQALAWQDTAERELRNAERRLVAAERIAAALEAERDQARDAIADERRGRLAAEAAVRRVRELAASWTELSNAHIAVRRRGAEILAALDAEQEAPGAERAAPIDWEAIVRQRERELKQVGEARHQAEAAVRRVKHVLAWKTLLAGPQAEKAVRVADVEAALDAEQPKETP